MMAKYYFPPLRYLNANRARVAVLDSQLPKLIGLAEKLANDVSIHTTQFGDDTGCIHGVGSHGDPTQRHALEGMPDDVVELLNDIRQMTIERHCTAARIEIAEQALAFLPDRERLIVKLRAVDGMSWFDVLDALCEQTGEIISDRTARNIYDRACEKIAPFFTSSGNDNSQDRKRPYYKSITA